MRGLPTLKGEVDMGKRRLALQVRLPAYRYPRNAWRCAIHTAISQAVTAQQVQYVATDKLELSIILYLSGTALGWHDVDNRLKDIMDALQGRAGGSKKERRLHAVIPNDNQIHKVTIEKQTPPGQSHGLGHLTIRRYRAGK